MHRWIEALYSSICSREGVRVPLKFQCKDEMDCSLCLLRGRNDWAISMVSSTSGSWREQTQEGEFAPFSTLKGGVGCGGEDRGGCWQHLSSDTMMLYSLYYSCVKRTCNRLCR